ncbi:unnamed protein product [Symbiodinium sp. KB8]|nr:unnamed protein product [Symbiodinium sp. KB8]
MPRSVPFSTSGSSAEASSESSSPSADRELERPLYYDMSGPPNPPRRTPSFLGSLSDDQLQLSERSVRSLGWFRNIVLRFFCWQMRRSYMELVLQEKQRSISASMAAWGRTQHDLPAEDVLERTIGRVDEATATRLRADFEWLSNQLRQEPARNDRAWILTTGNQFCPAKHVMQQQLWPAVVAALQQQLMEELVAEVADTIFNMASSMWYQDYLTALLPWLHSDEQLRFQQWFQEYERLQFQSLPGPSEPAMEDDEPHPAKPNDPFSSLLDALQVGIPGKLVAFSLCSGYRIQRFIGKSVHRPAFTGADDALV